MSEKFDFYSKIFYRDVEKFVRHLCRLVLRHQMPVWNYFVNSFYSACVWIFLWSVSLEWQEAHVDDGYTQTIPPRLSPDIQMIKMFFKPASHWPASRALIGRYGP